MEQNATSFWSDIKKYEDALAKDPNSYCFAPLAELYRKVGLLDDALSVAKRGCELHPDYVGGYMALGRAYFEKGMMAESQEALERVVRVTPDNLLAHKLLSQIHTELGNYAAAESALQTILAINPGDSESQMMLETLLRSEHAVSIPDALLPEASERVSPAAEVVGEGPEDAEFLLEDLEVIEDLTVEAEGTAPVIEAVVEAEQQKFEEDFAFEEPFAFDDDLREPDLTSVEIAAEPEAMEPPTPTRTRDPLATTTIAELYVKQGFLDRALRVYHEILEGEPDNVQLKARIAELRQSCTERDQEVQETAAPAGEPVESSQGVLREVAAGVSGPGGQAEVLATLERWLENVRRKR